MWAARGAGGLSVFGRGGPGPCNTPTVPCGSGATQEVPAAGQPQGKLGASIF